MEDLLEKTRLETEQEKELKRLEAKLLLLEEKFDAVMNMHNSKCKITEQMDSEWQLEKVKLSEKFNQPEIGIAIHDLTTRNYEFHNNIHEKWLLHQAIDLNQPNNHGLLKNLTTTVNRIIFLQNLLVGYDLLMSLPPKEQKNCWMKFHLSLKSKSNKPNCYVIKIMLYKFDDKDCPWLLLIKMVRLSEVWIPSDKHYCEYSHSLSTNIKRIHKVKPPFVTLLTAMEAEVLKLGIEGYSVDVTAKIMGSTARNIKNARERIYRKTNTHNIKQAFYYIERHKLVD